MAEDEIFKVIKTGTKKSMIIFINEKLTAKSNNGSD